MNDLIFKRKDKNVLLITCIFFKNKRKRLHNYQLHSRYSPSKLSNFTLRLSGSFIFINGSRYLTHAGSRDAYAAYLYFVFYC